MANAIKVPKSAVASLVKATFPEYRGRRFRLEVSSRVTFYGTFWDGGSRNTYKAVRVADLATSELAIGSAPFLGMAIAEGKIVEIPAGYAIVEHSIFCGRDMGIRVYVPGLPALAGEPIAALHGGQ